MKPLSFNTSFVKYAKEAILPFYILHQTVVISLGFFVVRWGIPDLNKSIIILVAIFATTIGLYEFGVRRLYMMGFLFGMKPKQGILTSVRSVLEGQEA